MRVHPRRLVVGVVATCLVALGLLGLGLDPGPDSQHLARQQLNAKLESWLDAEGGLVGAVRNVSQQSLISANTSKHTGSPPEPSKNLSATGGSQVFIPYVPPAVGHDNSIRRVWPQDQETEDRILSQMALQPAASVTKKILVHRGVSTKDSGHQKLIAHKCPVTNCDLTGDMKQASTADAILFEGAISEPAYTLGKHRPPNQLWILYFLESPHHTMGLRAFYGKVNFTATYRRDSTMVTPYERWVQFANITSLPLKPDRDYAKGKTKKVAWFVSNCGARNGRMEYAKELSKYISVDIYGHCGTLKCPRIDSKCFTMLRTDYKFYLSFENSNCKDYITEKLYWNAYQSVITPCVVHGVGYLAYKLSIL